MCNSFGNLLNCIFLNSEMVRLTLIKLFLWKTDPDSHSQSIRITGSSLGGQSFSTDASLSPLRFHNTNFDDEDIDAEEPPTQDTVDRENSFEDLEQFLSQMDWASPHCSTNDSTLDSELTCDPSMQLDESHMEELEMRALKEHLKSIVKDIHIAIGEHSDGV